MRRVDPPVARDTENPDPQELNKPIPKRIVALVCILLGWAIYYIAHQAPGLESSSSAGTQAVAPPRAG